MFETMAMEIEQLLSRVSLLRGLPSFKTKGQTVNLLFPFQLTEVNDKMSDYTQNLGVNSQSAALLHTLQRHRDILQDYSHEFHKTKANILAYRDREDLLGAVHRDIE